MADKSPIAQASVFQPELLKGEQILWTGQPKPKLFTARDFVFVPFGILLVSFVITWILGACGALGDLLSVQRLPSQSGFINLGIVRDTLFVVGLMGTLSIFLGVGIYLSLGRFIVKNWRQRHTYYGVTNERALILSNIDNRFLQTIFIDRNLPIYKFVNANGTGTIIFGNSHSKANIWANIQMEVLPLKNRLLPAFCDIQNVDALYELIDSQRNSRTT